MNSIDHTELDALRRIVVDTLADAPLEEIAARLDYRNQLRMPRRRRAPVLSERHRRLVKMMSILNVS